MVSCVFCCSATVRMKRSVKTLPWWSWQRDQSILTECAAQLPLGDYSRRKYKSKFNHKSVLEAFFLSGVFFTLYGFTQRFSPLTLNPGLFCFLLLSWQGVHDKLTGDTDIQVLSHMNIPPTPACSLVHHLIRYWQVNIRAFLFRRNCSFRDALQFCVPLLPRKLGGPLVESFQHWRQGTAAKYVAIIASNTFH